MVSLLVIYLTSVFVSFIVAYQANLGGTIVGVPNSKTEVDPNTGF